MILMLVLPEPLLLPRHRPFLAHDLRQHRGIPDIRFSASNMSNRVLVGLKIIRHGMFFYPRTRIEFRRRMPGEENREKISPSRPVIISIGDPLLFPPPCRLVGSVSGRFKQHYQLRTFMERLE